jgi:hypothetical protein
MAIVNTAAAMRAMVSQMDWSRRDSSTLPNPPVVADSVAAPVSERFTAGESCPGPG